MPWEKFREFYKCGPQPSQGVSKEFLRMRHLSLSWHYGIQVKRGRIIYQSEKRANIEP